MLLFDTNFLEGHRLSVENAKKHYKIAELIVQNNVSYGIAISHMILAAEEILKAGMVGSKHYMPNVEVKDFDQYFLSHKHKHEVIINIEKAYALINKIRKSAKSITRNKKIIGTAKKKPGVVLGAILQELISTDFSLKANETWWKQANHKKNLGFYVNLNGSNGTWESPSHFEMKDYLKTKHIVKELMSHYIKMEALFESPEGQEYLKENNSLFKDNLS